jgi:hypothetical protein
MAASLFKDDKTADTAKSSAQLEFYAGNRHDVQSVAKRTAFSG